MPDQQCRAASWCDGLCWSSCARVADGAAFQLSPLENKAPRGAGFAGGAGCAGPLQLRGPGCSEQQRAAAFFVTEGDLVEAGVVSGPASGVVVAIQQVFHAEVEAQAVAGLPATPQVDYAVARNLAAVGQIVVAVGDQLPAGADRPAGDDRCCGAGG